MAKQTQPLMPRDREFEVMQLSYEDTLRTTMLDGSAAAALSAVIDSENESVVRLYALDDATAYYKRGSAPVAADEDGVAFFGEKYVVIPKGEKISVFGANVNVTVLRWEQEDA